MLIYGEEAEDKDIVLFPPTVNVFPPTNTEKFLMKKAKENLSTLESTVINFSLWRRWLYVYFLNSSLDIVAKK